MAVPAVIRTAAWHRTRGMLRTELEARNVARCARIVATPTPLVLDDLQWETVPDHPVDDGVLRCLVYMRDVEGFTDREPVGFAAHRTTLADPTIRKFLDRWRAEERGHTDALSRFLDAYAATGTTAIPPRQLPPPAMVPRHERLLATVGGPVGGLVAAAHMVWGAANELLTLQGYRLLAARCGHPLLRELLTRIAHQEARHFSFYVLQAEWRLATSATARRVLARVMQHRWTPVGVGDAYKSSDDFAAVYAYLAAGEDGRRVIDRMDRRFAALPGFGALRIYTNAAP